MDEKEKPKEENKGEQPKPKSSVATALPIVGVALFMGAILTMIFTSKNL